MRQHLCLIVDDEPAIRGYLKAVLGRGHFQSIEAENPVKALQLLQEFSAQIDVVITDIQMPGDMDGIDLAYWVRRKSPKLPVILISGYTGKEVPDSFAFVQKPFDSAAILEVVTRAIPATNVPDP